MKRHLPIVFALLIALITTACAASAELAGGADSSYAPQAAEDDFGEFEESAAEDFAAEPSSSGGANRTNIQVQERLIIRTGSISISSDDTLATRDAVEDLVAQYAGAGAFIVNVNQYGGAGEERPNVDMSIRVPSENFDAVMDEIAALGVDVFNRTESGQDVTEEYVDVQARLESLEAARDRLLELLDQAETTEALLQAEQQLTQREQEIEALRGRLQYLEESAALSSISITITPTRTSQPIDTRWRPGETIIEAFDRLINSLRNFADFAIIFAISVLPWLLLFGGFVYAIIRVIIWGIRRLSGRGKTNNGNAPPSGDDVS